MPYSPKQKQQTRERILESARRLFNRKGFSDVSIQEIMTHARLTHGGFYRHFSGKEEVYAEAIRYFLCRKTPERWQGKKSESGTCRTRAERIAAAYFSRAHFDDRDTCCPILGMASDRSGRAVKTAYREVAEKLACVFEAHLNEPHARERALALVALCVGGMVLARGVDDDNLANDFRTAAYEQVLMTTGWRGI